jgi:hypothetical protein
LLGIPRLASDIGGLDQGDEYQYDKQRGDQQHNLDVHPGNLSLYLFGGENFILARHGRFLP